MKKITLKKLILQDWRAQNKVVEFTDNTEIRGYNKSGKSSIYNAFLWLLTGADADDRNNYNIFDNTVEQIHENSKTASVEGVFEIDGVEYTFRRTARIGWVRKKEKDEYERKGTDVYKFYIDGIDRGANDYKKNVEELFAPIDKLKIMLNLQYFLKLDWRDMRKQFELMVGEISDKDFITDYSDIQDLLQKFNKNIDAMKTHLRSKIQKIEKSVGKPGYRGELEIEIETIKKLLPTDLRDIRDYTKEIADITKQIEAIDKEIIGGSEGIRQYIDKRNDELKQISQLTAEYNRLESEYNLAHNRTIDDKKMKLQGIDARNDEIRERIKQKNQERIYKKDKIAVLEKNIAKLQQYREVLIAQNNEAKAMQFTEETCVYCGQRLPDDKLVAAKAKFYANKEAKHKAIVAEGKANNLKIEQYKREIEDLRKEIENMPPDEPFLNRTDLELDIADLTANFIEYDKTIDGQKKLAEIAYMKANLTIIPDTSNTELINTKKILLEDIQELSKKQKANEYYNGQLNLISEKQDELRRSAIELARLEGLLNKVNKYEREKAQIISDRVNGRFDYVKVEMTEVNKLGELVDTCKILDADGVNATSTNFASKIRCGIDISTAFCKFCGVKTPLFIDFAESICEGNYPETERQTVKLIVDNCNFKVINK